jgi:hypothetical protein
MQRVVDLLRISFQKGQKSRPFPMIVRAVGRHPIFRELLCGNKVRYSLNVDQATYIPSGVRSVGRSLGAYIF